MDLLAVLLCVRKYFLVKRPDDVEVSSLEIQQAFDRIGAATSCSLHVG